MTEFDMAIHTLNQISIRGEEDASRLLGVCNFIRKASDEFVVKNKALESVDKTVSKLQSKIAELEAQAKAKEE